jgi:hypothetical protein
MEITEIRSVKKEQLLLPRIIPQSDNVNTNIQEEYDLHSN